MKIKFSFQFREHEDTKDVIGYIGWLKKEIVPRILNVPGVARIEVSQNVPFSFLPDSKPIAKYVCQMDIFYKTEEDFQNSMASFNDAFLVQELIKADDYLDLHICYIENIEKKKIAMRSLFGNWGK
jgi:hypothetical protein